MVRVVPPEIGRQAELEAEAAAAGAFHGLYGPLADGVVSLEVDDVLLLVLACLPGGVPFAETCGPAGFRHPVVEGLPEFPHVHGHRQDAASRVVVPRPGGGPVLLHRDVDRLDDDGGVVRPGLRLLPDPLALDRPVEAHTNQAGVGLGRGLVPALPDEELEGHPGGGLGVEEKDVVALAFLEDGDVCRLRLAGDGLRFGPLRVSADGRVEVVGAVVDDQAAPLEQVGAHHADALLGTGVLAPVPVDHPVQKEGRAVAAFHDAFGQAGGAHAVARRVDALHHAVRVFAGIAGDPARDRDGRIRPRAGIRPVHAGQGVHLPPAVIGIRDDDGISGLPVHDALELEGGGALVFRLGVLDGEGADAGVGVDPPDGLVGVAGGARAGDLVRIDRDGRLAAVGRILEPDALDRQDFHGLREGIPCAQNDLIAQHGLGTVDQVLPVEGNAVAETVFAEGGPLVDVVAVTFSPARALRVNDGGDVIVGDLEAGLLRKAFHRLPGRLEIPVPVHGDRPVQGPAAPGVFRTRQPAQGAVVVVQLRLAVDVGEIRAEEIRHGAPVERAVFPLHLGCVHDGGPRLEERDDDEMPDVHAVEVEVLRMESRRIVERVGLLPADGRVRQDALPAVCALLGLRNAQAPVSGAVHEAAVIADPV